ncbi:hypothetical protein PR003_g12486 [Phytophthora rubi]|uniref:Retrotransposon Copia-like N-terminal domain-containing protein n=2 Tax=Phytophthora rubi TaxID=129364 RepID=A0A6A4FCE2_9STRA|nr:hypothetical protein PR001_g8678 [Phytophthora rubi]KAE9336506.1 hypothetical protein PR003_g12486 [Phytophthora rubi]
MSPKTLGPNDLLQDNYFLWEFNARMALARKNLLSHVQVKSENVMTAEWEASDMKALGILVQLLSPNYQAMVREAKSAREAWETLRSFFVQKSLHNRVCCGRTSLSTTLGPDRKAHGLCVAGACL